MALQIVVVGLGQRGRNWVREIRTHPNWELAGAADPDRDALREAARDLALAPDQCCDSVEQALDRFPNCTAAVVATPPDVHVAPCQAAISKGLAVMVEKPFTTCLADAVNLVAQAEEVDVPLLVAQNLRYLRSQQAARRLVHDGTLGRVGLVVSHHFAPPTEMQRWMGRIRHPALWERAVHHVDALRYVLDRQITGVLADSFSFPSSDGPGGATVEVLLEFEGGTRATCGVTYESSGHEYFEGGRESFQRFVGDRATLHVLHRWLLLCERGRLPKPVRRGSRPASEEAVLLEQLADAVRTRREAECSGRDNLQTIAALEACVRSADEGRRVNPQEVLREHA